MYGIRKRAQEGACYYSLVVGQPVEGEKRAVLLLGFGPASITVYAFYIKKVIALKTPHKNKKKLQNNPRTRDHPRTPWT